MPSVQKWGNSLGIRVPKSVAEQVDLRDGSAFEFDTSGGVLKIRPKQRRRRRSEYTLAQLLAKTKGPSPYRHLDRVKPVGRELL